ncbi:MAG: hypothetical protein ACE367_23510 [Acidimicrobiales bacterium]
MGADASRSPDGVGVCSRCNPPARVDLGGSDLSRAAVLLIEGGGGGR